MKSSALIATSIRLILEKQMKMKMKTQMN